MNTNNKNVSIYSISDIFPVFEYMHKQIGLSSDLFKTQNEIARTIWLTMRIDGEIKNGGLEQLFANLGEDFDANCLIEVLANIKSEKGLKIIQKFIDFIYQTDKHYQSFHSGKEQVKGFNKTLKKLHNELSDEYYTIDPSVEALIVQYAEANWNNEDFQEAIKEVVFASKEKDESALISDLNQAIKSGNIATIKKILKNLESVNQACKYGFVPLLELVYLSDSAKKIAIAQLLIDHGADLNFRDQYQNSVLHKTAGQDKKPEFMAFLLDQGMAVNLKDDFDNTPIFEAMYSPEMCQLLIDRGADLTLKNRNGYTPLSKMLERYYGWYGNKFAKEYQPPVKQVIDVLLAAGATFSSGILIHEMTELAKFAEDPKMMKHLLQHPSVKNAPEFQADYQKWSAVFEASLKGNLDCLKLLAAKGAFLNQALAVPHYATQTFCGATPMTVALNDEVRTFLAHQNGVAGERTAYSLFLETRGNDEAAVIDLIQYYKNSSPAAAAEDFQTVKKIMNETFEEIDGKYVIYRPLFLASIENEADAKAIEAAFHKYNCELTII